MPFQLSWYTVDGKVFVHQMEVAGLELFEQVVAELADESVIVLTLDVNNKLFVASLCTLRERHYSLESNGPLEDYGYGKSENWAF